MFHSVLKEGYHSWGMLLLLHGPVSKRQTSLPNVASGNWYMGCVPRVCFASKLVWSFPRFSFDLTFHLLSQAKIVQTFGQRLGEALSSGLRKFSYFGTVYRVT